MIPYQFYAVIQKIKKIHKIHLFSDFEVKSAVYYDYNILVLTLDST